MSFSVLIYPFGIAVLALGLLATFLGARLSKPVLFLCTFLVAGYIGMEAAETIGLDRSLVLVAGASIGLIAGLGSFVFFKVGVFALGMLACAAAAQTLLKWGGIDLTGLWLIAVALIGGIAFIVFERWILIVGTTTAGATLCLLSVEIFLAPSAIPDLTRPEDFGDVGGRPALWRVIYLVVWVALWAAGVKVQSRRKRAVVESDDRNT